MRVALSANEGRGGGWAAKRDPFRSNHFIDIVFPAERRARTDYRGSGSVVAKE